MFPLNNFFPFDNFLFLNKLLHDHVDINIILIRIISISSIFMDFDIQRIGRTYSLTWGGGYRCDVYGRCWKMATYSVDKGFYIIDFI